MSLTLISATPSPYARKVRITLAEKNIPFTLQTEVPWDSTSQTATSGLNPLQKLPILIIPAAGIPSLNLPATKEDTAIFESRFILEWIEAKFPPPRYKSMLPTSEDDRLSAREIEVVCDGLCDAMVLRFFESQREHPSSEWTARQMRKLDAGMAWLDSKLSPGQEFMVGGEFGLADVCTGTLCGYLDVRFQEYGYRGKWPGLAGYVDGLNGRESFRGTVPRAQKISDKIV